jgi:ubiquitin carboxyl-terminal hydrolase 22/27/51
MDQPSLCAHSGYVASDVFKSDLQNALKAALLVKKMSVLQQLHVCLPQPACANQPVPPSNLFYCHECQGRSGNSLLCSIARPSFFCSAKACRAAHSALVTAPLVAVDIETLEIYCEECKCVLINEHIDALKMVLLPDLIKQLNPIQPPGLQHLQQFTAPPALVGGHGVIEFGLKGMYNAGNSCFINAVLQCICHLHSVRAFFLSGRHVPENCPYCKLESSCNSAVSSGTFPQANGNADDGGHNLRGCLACELDGIIQDMYTPGSSSGPVMPHRFIYALWLQSKNLAGYQQHDAHEFFICCVDELSKACEAYSKSSSLQIGPLFSGSCLSSVTCNACGAVSGNEELFRDISLDISGDGCDAMSLSDCLGRFTRLETLDADASRVCPTCHGNSFSKQLSVTRPPSLLCLHLKRFEHDAASGRFTKIDRHVNICLIFHTAALSFTTEFISL